MKFTKGLLLIVPVLLGIHNLTAQVPSGGTMTNVGNYTIHTFTANGTLTVYSPVDVEVLVVAGGGAGGNGVPAASCGGGGGAGGVLYSSVMTLSAGSYPVTVGAGGASGGQNGGNSIFNTLTAIGGGAGGNNGNGGSTGQGQVGGSGGGGSTGTGVSGAAGTAGQGYSGASGSAGPDYNAGGGGGGNPSGGPGWSNGGGFRYSLNIYGYETFYAGGGGGGTNNSTPCYGGGGGAGNGGTSVSQNGGAASANSGSGGGGGKHSGLGGAGGSGIVIIKRLTAVAAPTVAWHTLPPTPLYLNSWFPVRATGSDTDGNLGGVWVEYSVNGGAWQALAYDPSGINGGDGYNTTSNNNGIVAGGPGTAYQFRCYAWDQAGANSGWQYSGTYTVANRAPSVTLSVEPTSIYFGQSATVSSTATDADGNLAFHGILALFQDGSNWYRSPDTDHSTGWGNHPTSTDFVSASYTSGVASGSSSSRSVVHRPSWTGTITYHSNAHDNIVWQSSASPYVYAYLTVNKSTPVGAFSPRSFTGTHTLTASDLNASFSNPYSGAVAAPTGVISYNYPVGSVLTPGTYTVIATSGGDSNYNSATASATFTISQTTSTVTWSPPAAIVYGAALSSTQLNATASVPGTFAYSPIAGSVLSAGAKTLNVTFTPTDTVSYTTATASVSLTVNQAPLTIKGNDATKTYGAANPTLTAAYTGFVNGDSSSVVSGLVLATTATPSSPVGSYPITPSGASAANYSIGYQNGTLTITTGGQVVTLTRGTTSVTTGNTGSTSASTFALITFVASNGSSGQYTWTIDGVTQSNTSTQLTTSFATAGVHTVSAAAAAGGNFAASAPATFNVSVSAGNLWTAATGSGHIVALKSDGTVWTWGGNGSGQLGDGSTNDRVAPMQVTGLTSVVAVAAGSSHSAAVKSDGTVWTWGANGTGQLGDGTISNRLLPVQVTGITGIVDIVAGSGHTMALKSDGTVWAWGTNVAGQLGDGTTTQRNAPVQIGTLANVAFLAAGTDHSVAVKADGSVWSWGKNDAGQTGDGTTSNRSTPAQVAGLASIIEAAAGTSHTMALKTDGTVWTWGSNASGQLGDGTTTQRAAPVQASGLTGISTIAAGSDHSVAIKSDGSVRTWGNNATGQIGDGTTTNRTAPVAVNGPASIVATSAKASHTVVVRNDGTIYTWGGDGFGSATVINRRINLAAIRLVPASGDTDQDGMLDALEIQYFGNLTRNGVADFDADGLVDVQELYVGSDPTKVNTDGDATTDPDDPYPADYYNNAAPSIVVIGGNNQTTAAGQFNNAPFDLAIATNPGSQLLVNAPVTLTVVTGGGSLATSNLPSATLSSTLSLLTDAAGTVRSYYKQPFSAGVSSQIKVMAGQSQLFLASTSSTAPNTPPTPGNLVSVAVTSSSVNLFWTTSDASNVAGYNIYRNGSLVATTSGTATYFTDQNLSSSTAFTYTVQAFNSVGVLSTVSATTNATTVASTTPNLEIFSPLK